MKAGALVVIAAGVAAGALALGVSLNAPAPSLVQVTPSLGVGKPYAILMPVKALTPGKADTTSLAVICGTTTKSRRKVSEATKRQVFKEYGITFSAGAAMEGGPTRAGYEVDHLIPLAIGGSNDITNLWPQPATPVPGFHQKDVLEVKLHALVCSGKLSARKAQAQVATNWSDAYFQYVK